MGSGGSIISYSSAYQDRRISKSEYDGLGPTIGRPKVNAYNSSNTACMDGVQAVSALQLFETMQSQELTPNGIAYNSAITACANAGRSSSAVPRDDAIAGAHAHCDRPQLGEE